MRGKVRSLSISYVENRITPAYAGKSTGIATCYKHYQDHPRLCGEKRLLTALTWIRRGSPPPMRGKENYPFWGIHIVRITPAYAGKSRCSCCVCRVQQDHPRLCGEKRFRKAPLYGAWGSPPPMRGKAYDSPLQDTTTGITPAYAGKSGVCCWHYVIHEDHPRLCGEKIQVFC